MDFAKHKNDFLNKEDKSEKKSIDKDIIKLVNLINSKGNYYTTSSCAGRIEILELIEGERHTNKFFSFHDSIKLKNISNITKKINKTNKKVWFKQESLILHVCCRTIMDANKLLKIAREIGFKRSGIISKGRKITTEIINPEYMLTIIAENGKLLTDKNYLKILISEANKKMEKNKRKTEEFYKSVRIL